MAVYVKRSTDPGAPLLTGSAGSLIALLDYLLVGMLGWTKAFVDGTGNIAAYQQPVGSNGFFLRVDNTVAATARVVGYETMGDVNTGSGAFPTSTQFASGLYVLTATAGTAVPWRFFSNGKIFYLFLQTSSGAWVGYAFGDLVPYKPGDAYDTVLIAGDGSTVSNNRFFMLNTTYAASLAAHYMTRTYTQLGTAIVCGKFSDYPRAGGATYMGNGGQAYPSPAEGGVLLAPVWIGEAACARGLLPGLWNPLHNLPLVHGDTFGGVGNLLGRTFEVQGGINGGGGANSAQCFLETSDTWGEP